ncbi:hypothetical protein ALNOE001_09220 [Candidatus Methanobinarius endosymbioticus]|uniref:Uncharacterized protein n=1 Tax=Candidatus Methanobinarius endosymbioticus TaxID=2006182 RepID=A0A366MCY6_9EURY|nr:hypothetical protein ALNOE001_09220 [Candidatus Methanobinarius endosymbioticus]
MKKPNLKNILKRFTIIDVLIVIVIIGTIVFALMYTGGDEEKSESVSFDSSTMNKLAEKYLSFYQEGKIVKTHVGGYNSSDRKYQELYGTIIWVDDNKGSDVQVLIDIDGDSKSQSILARLYKDNKNADLYIEHITLETDGKKYENLTEIQINPKNIGSLDEITNNIGNNTNYTISGKISTNEKDSETYQQLSNELFLNGRKQSTKPINENTYDQIQLIMANKTEINIASEILGNIDGQTGILTIRIYNSNPEDIQQIENSFDVFNIRKIT